MAMWSKSQLGIKAKELGFVRDAYEKVCRLTEVLTFFESDDLLGRVLALKGGTAINLTVFNLPRLSVDIDLDFTEDVCRDEMMKSRSQIDDRIIKYMQAYGYSLSPKSKYHHALDSYVFDYMNSGGAKDNIKIEINYMLRCHIFPTEQNQFTSMWDQKTIQVLSVDSIELFVSKIVALLNRIAARDIYDIYNLTKADLFDESGKSLLRKSVVYYSAITSESQPREFDLGRMNEITQNQIRRELYPVLRNSEKFDYQSSVAQIKLWLTDLLAPEEDEWAFLNCFRENRYQPELLFDDPEILNRIKNHPMALWKTQRLQQE